jgi:hypothetical protein
LKGLTGCSLSSRQRINLRGWLTELKNSKDGRVKSVDRDNKGKGKGKGKGKVVPVLN